MTKKTYYIVTKGVNSKDTKRIKAFNYYAALCEALFGDMTDLELPPKNITISDIEDMLAEMGKQVI